MQKFTITKAASKGRRFWLSPTWVSNGHWLVRRCWVKNASQSADVLKASLHESSEVTAVDDSYFAPVLENPDQYVDSYADARIEIVDESGKVGRVFRCGDGRWLSIDASYAHLLGLESILLRVDSIGEYSSACAELLEGEIQLLVMPRSDYASLDGSLCMTAHKE